MKTIERVVIDTNVLVSFVLRPFSVPGRAVRHVLDHHDVIVSAAVLDEFRDVIARPKFDRYAPAAKRRRFAVDLRRSAVVISIVHRVRACADPTDDKFLEAAVNGGADMILSGDRAPPPALTLPAPPPAPRSPASAPRPAPRGRR